MKRDHHPLGHFNGVDKNEERHFNYGIPSSLSLSRSEYKISHDFFLHRLTELQHHTEYRKINFQTRSPKKHFYLKLQRVESP